MIDDDDHVFRRRRVGVPTRECDPQTYFIRLRHVFERKEKLLPQIQEVFTSPVLFATMSFDGHFSRNVSRMDPK